MALKIRWCRFTFIRLYKTFSTSGIQYSGSLCMMRLQEAPEHPPQPPTHPLYYLTVWGALCSINQYKSPSEIMDIRRRCTRPHSCPNHRSGTCTRARFLVCLWCFQDCCMFQLFVALKSDSLPLSSRLFTARMQPLQTAIKLSNKKRKKTYRFSTSELRTRLLISNVCFVSTQRKK